MTSGRPIGRDSLVDELHRLYGKLQETPTVRSLKEKGRYSYTAYRNEFGSWNEALKAAGFKPNKRGASRETLIKELQRIAEEGEPPTKRDLEEESEHSYTAYRNEFGTWNEALLAAGFEPRVNKIPREDLLEALDDLAERLGKVPRVQDMKRKGRYSCSAYQNEFGTWNNALRTAGFRLNQVQAIPEEKLLAEIDRLSDESGPPTSPEMSERGDYSVSAYVRAFGSWNDAVREAGYEPHVEPGVGSGGDGSGGDRDERYGENWSEISYRIRERHGRCLYCGATQPELEKYGQSLSVHHVTTDRRLQESRDDGFGDEEDESNGSRPGKLVTLCPECHTEWEEIGIGPDIRNGEFDERGE